MKEIAAALDVSPRAVESPKYDSMQKLGVKTTAELIQDAIKNGAYLRLISPLMPLLTLRITRQNP